jgi:hypothetical protein
MLAAQMAAVAIRSHTPEVEVLVVLVEHLQCPMVLV